MPFPPRHPYYALPPSNRAGLYPLAQKREMLRALLRRSTVLFISSPYQSPYLPLDPDHIATLTHSTLYGLSITAYFYNNFHFLKFYQNLAQLAIFTELHHLTLDIAVDSYFIPFDWKHFTHLETLTLSMTIREFPHWL